MIAHQYVIRKEKSKIENIDFTPSSLTLSDLTTTIKLIDKETAKNVIIEYEWLKSMPFCVRYCFGLYFNINGINKLGGVLVFGDDYAENTGVWDKYGFENKVLLLSRGVCLWWTPKNSASFFISRACKWIKNNTKYRIITATIDPAAGEIGTIYQSLNWTYVGLMSGNYYHNREVKRFSVIIDGKLRGSRWMRKKIGTIKKDEILKHYPNAIFVPQYRKRRYFYFMDTKKQNIKYYNSIKHMIQPYPKRDNNIIGIIYKIKNKINNKLYIGQTTRSLNDRINDYKKGFCNNYLQNAFNKYGWDNFEFSIIDSAQSMDELNSKEIRYILEYKSDQKEFGYNIEGGGNNAIPTKETLEKMSKSHSGIKQSQEWVKRRIFEKGSDGAKNYGRKKSEEDKQHLSKNSSKFWLGKTRDEETRKKISETKKNNGLSEHQKEVLYKTVYVWDIETFEMIDRHESTGIASNVVGVNQATISRWCASNKIKDDKIWSYIDNVDTIKSIVNERLKSEDEKNRLKNKLHELEKKNKKLENKNNSIISRKRIKQSQGWVSR